jgi:ribA/ribD-fused uncharacterized protein
MNRDELIERVSRGERFEFHFFWGTASCLSQWHPAPFEVDGVSYRTAEHWMMAEKARLFGDEATLARIIAAKTPAEAKALGREVTPFDSKRWGAACVKAVVRGNVAKFTAHAPMRESLCSTGTKVLVEASPRDRIWGIGMGASNVEASDPQKWRGANLLGFALMEVRERIDGGAGRATPPGRWPPSP